MPKTPTEMDGRRSSSSRGGHASLVIAMFCLLLVTVYTKDEKDETAYECASEHFWNDDDLKTFTFHLRVTRKDIMLHAKQNPLDKGIRVADVEMYPLERIYLHVPLTTNLSVVVVYVLNPDKTSVLATQYYYDKDGNFETSSQTLLARFKSPVDNFHQALRVGRDWQILYDRRECDSLTPDTLYTFCENKKCEVGSGNNCIHDTSTEWRYTVPEKFRDDLDDFVVSAGCNLIYQRLSSAEGFSEMFVYKMALKDDRMNISLKDMPQAACYKIAGYQTQVIERNWNVSDDCREFPVEQYPPISHGHVLVYIGIFAGVIVVLVMLCGLYVFFCSDDEIDEHLPPPDTVLPVAGVPGSTTPADATPQAASISAAANVPPAVAPPSSAPLPV